MDFQPYSLIMFIGKKADVPIKLKTSYFGENQLLTQLVASWQGAGGNCPPRP